MKYATLAIIGLCAGAASAQDMGLTNIGVEAGLSTLGLYVAPRAEITPKWGVRAPLYYASFDDSFDVEGSTLDGSLKVGSFGLVADYHPTGGGFRLSGGLAIGGYDVDGASDTLTLDGTGYNGNFVAKFEQRSTVAPVISMGYAGRATSGWAGVAELGLRVTSMQLSVTGQEALPAAQRADFETDLATVNDDLKKLGVLPFANLALAYRF